MLDLLIDTFLDTLYTLPLLLAVYLLLGFFEGRLAFAVHPASKGLAGPIVGALAGSIPQCGFSSASAALYNNGMIGAGALIAVFLATSDEAIPILLANPGQMPIVMLLLVSKIAIAVIWGYIFYALLDRHRQTQPMIATSSDGASSHALSSRCGDERCSCQNFSLLGFALWHTMRIAVFLLVTLLIINTITYWIGYDVLSSLFLTNSLLQPLLAALIGLIPGCGTSVLLTTLYLKGTLSFGSAVAGLSAGAGFGYIILLQSQGRRGLRLLLYTYCAAAISGLVLQILLI